MLAVVEALSFLDLTESDRFLERQASCQYIVLRTTRYCVKHLIELKQGSRSVIGCVIPLTWLSSRIERKGLGLIENVLDVKAVEPTVFPNVKDNAYSL